MKTSTLRPGLLVGLSTQIKGNVSYVTDELETDHLLPDGSRRAKWETLRTVKDAEEHERATLARSKARSLITSPCAPSSFGLLCPDNRVADLDRAFTEAQEVVAEFNRSARVSRVSLNMIAARIEPDDQKAVRAINNEIRDLIAAMETGIEKLDVKAVRDAAQRARSMGAMLSDSAKENVQKAVDAARSMATKMVKAGDGVAIEIDKQVIDQLRFSRTAFLDMDEAEEVRAPASDTSRAVEFEPEAMAAIEQPRANVPQIEL